MDLRINSYCAPRCVVFLALFIATTVLISSQANAVDVTASGANKAKISGSKWMMPGQSASRTEMIVLPVPPAAEEAVESKQVSVPEPAQALKKTELQPVREIKVSEKPVVAVSKPAAQMPKDLVRKPFFNLELQKTDMPRINAGRHWFSWFRKEEAVAQMPVGQTLRLDDCITIAIRNYIPLQVANDSVKLAQLRVNEAKRNLLPTATVVYETYTGEVNARQYVGRKQYIEGQQPVFRGGELVYSVKQAQANLEITKIDRDRIKNELVLQVKKAYYAVGKARENLKIQQELFAEVSKIRDMVKKEAEFNVTSRLELLNVNSQASQTQYQLTTAEGDVGIAELILKQSMNVDPQDELLVDPILDFKKVDISYEEAVRAAYKLRPEIRANTLLLDYYNLGRKVAKAKGWPKIDLLGSWGLAKEEYTPEDSLGPTSPTGAAGTNGPIYDQDQKLEQQFYAGVKASMPFWGSTGEYSWTREQWVPVVSAYQGTEASTHTFKLKVLDRLDYYSERQQSEVEYDRARQELNKTKQEVTLEVKEGCFNYQKAILQLETATNKVKYQAMDLETTRFRRGMDEVQDSNLIDSMTKLAQEKFSYAQALADCHTALASVNKAIGVDDFYKDETGPKK